MLSKSATVALRCCQGVALLLGCARVEGVQDTDGGAPPGIGGGNGPTRGTGGTGTGTGGLIMGRGTGGTGEEPVCGLFKAPLEKLPPDVLIVLDRSLSMNAQVIPPGFDLGMFVACLLLNNCPMTASKWVSMTGALNTSVAASAASVNFGLKFFPSDDLCGVNDAVAVPVAPNNSAAIGGAMATVQPGGFTPTAAALASAGRYLATLTDRNPRFVLLATDGEPNCGNGADNMGGGSDSQAAVAAVTNLVNAGIPVYVIGIATQGVADDALSAMARAGGRPRNATPAYYPVQTAADLTAALSAIGGQIASCTFAVARPEPPASPTNVVVKGNGMRIPQSDTDGWRWGPGMMSIEITGSWCQQIQAGTITDLQTTFACMGTIIG
jgi:hypothetical protein